MAVEIEDKKKRKTEPPPPTPRDRGIETPGRSALERFFPNGTPLQRQIVQHHARSVAEAVGKAAAAAAKTEPPASSDEG